MTDPRLGKVTRVKATYYDQPTATPVQANASRALIAIVTLAACFVIGFVLMALALIQ